MLASEARDPPTFRTAEELREEGRREGEVRTRQKDLLLVPRARFGKVPRARERIVNNTEDPRLLATWLGQAATVSRVAEVGIVAPALPKNSRRRRPLTRERKELEHEIHRKQVILILLLCARFPGHQEFIQERIFQTDDLEQLTDWQVGALLGKALDEIGLVPASAVGTALSRR